MIRFRVALFLPVLFAASVVGAQAKRPMSFADVMEIKTVDAVALAPDASAIVFSVSAWEHPNARRNSDPTKPDTAKGDRHDMPSHLWLVPVAGGQPRQLTFGERGESAPAWSPDGRSIAFLATRGTGEDVKRQIWILPMGGGEANQLSSGKDGAGSFAWSADGKRIAFLALDTLSKDDEAKRRRKDDPQIVEGSGRLAHLWIIDVGTKVATEIVHGDVTVKGAPTWSPDGSRLAYRASPTPLLRETRTAAYIVTLADRHSDKISVRSDVESTPVWAPDGRTLAYTIRPQTHTPSADGISEMQIGNNHLVLYDVGARTTMDTYDAKADLSEDAPQWTPDSRRLVFVTRERAFNAVYAYDVAARRLTRVVDKTLLARFSLSSDGHTTAFALATPDAPADVHVSDLTFSAPRKLTELNPGIRALALGATEIVTWTSADGTPVEGVLLKPAGYEAGRRYPLLVEAHGGPTYATSAEFKADWTSPGQVWAGNGWAVLYPNPRGSLGYGERFEHANIMDWGGGDYRDIMSGVDELVRRGLADSTKLALEGWSYGGYMTAWTVGQTTRFKAASMGAGLTDLQSMYGTTDLPGYIAMFFRGVPTQQTLDLYSARSPITFADKVTTPLLILHGESDTRVPSGQSTEFYRSLRDRGKTVELVIYPREWHTFSEYYHLLDKMQREYDWIAKYTLGDAHKENAAPVAAQLPAMEPSVFRVRGIAVPTPNGEQRGLSSDSLPSRDLQWSPATTKGAQIGLNFGLLQLGLGGFNVATELRYRRLWLEYSHGMLLTLNNLGGFGLTQTERDQKLHIRVPFTTGFGVGFTVVDELWLGAEFKAHGYEVNAPGGPVSHYRTYSIGPVLGYKYYIWNGLYADAYGRYWPNVATSLDGGKVTLVGNQGTVEHTAHDFGLFGNVSLGYMFRR